MADDWIPVRRDSNGSIYLSYDHHTVVEGVPVRLCFAEALEGRIVLTRVEVGHDFEDTEVADPLPVTTKLWRAISIGRLTQEAVLKLIEDTHVATDQAETWEAVGVEHSHVAPLRAQADAVRAAAESSLERRPGRPPLYDDDHWAAVLRVYRSGARWPRKAVMEAFNLSASAASKQIEKAKRWERDRGE